MELNQIIMLNNQIISLETLECIEQSEFVDCIENNGCSGKYYGKTWYSVMLNQSFVNEYCDDCLEIQVYL